MHASDKGFVAGVTGLEPATSGVTGQRSNQLSYTPHEAAPCTAPPAWVSSGQNGNSASGAGWRMAAP